MCEIVDLMPLIYKLILFTFCVFAWGGIKALFR